MRPREPVRPGKRQPFLRQRLLALPNRGNRAAIGGQDPLDLTAQRAAALQLRRDALPLSHPRLREPRRSLGNARHAAVEIANLTPTTLTFDSTEIAAAKTKTVSTRNITQSLPLSLVNNLSLSVSALGLGIDVTALLGTVKPAVTALLTSVTAPVDTLLYNTLAMLGIGIGQADVRVTGATCGRAVLVQ